MGAAAGGLHKVLLAQFSLSRILLLVVFAKWSTRTVVASQPREKALARLGGREQEWQAHTFRGSGPSGQVVQRRRGLLLLLFSFSPKWYVLLWLRGDVWLLNRVCSRVSA
eukprot:SM000085S23302  [mRNA]  locus=s85:413690:415447:- [translate_table: standard]